jgi:hypothetical protein
MDNEEASKVMEEMHEGYFDPLIFDKPHDGQKDYKKRVLLADSR